MSEYEFTLSLCVRHPNLDPSLITHALGVEPQHSWKAGDQRLGPVGEALEGVYHQSYWTARLMNEPQRSSAGMSAESALLQTLALLRRSNDFLQQLNTEGGVVELVVSLFAREGIRLDLTAESLALLAGLPLTIALDFQPQSPRDDDDAPDMAD